MTLVGVLILIAQIIGGLLLLTLIVVVHEFGHYLMARKNGIEVEEFGIGFPPRAWSKKLKNGVIFSINWLPIGGFCRVKGENSADKRKGTYGAASFKGKTQFLLAGVVSNLILAAVVFTGLSLFGMPKLVASQFTVPADNHEILGPVEVSQVVAGSVAAKNDLQTGDILISLNGEPILRSTDLPKMTAAYKSQEVSLVVKRADAETTKTLTLGDGTSGKGVLGVSTFSTESNRATWSAPIVGVALTGQLTYETFKGLGGMLANLFSGIWSNLQGVFGAGDGTGGAKIAAAGDGLSGPIGIVGILFPGAFASGASMVLLLVGIISLSLAVMNLLPIPALDGGRWLMVLISKISKKEISQQTEEKIITRGFLVILALAALTIFLDVWRIIK
ncbi:MAG: site-2 protease family protein [Candidatus Nomurabacteria bacterium]|jgi:regulator of sigma E protease|nr:site-2 protease family protein [Candidatus Nomurabacteria bacterium]